MSNAFGKAKAARPASSVCRCVRELRLKKRLSQEELAHRPDLDRSYVDQVERGERNISLYSIRRLVKAFHVEASRLV
ncbi:MAG: helix-turn-helix transcriptional regulator [Cryobacterium sp.]|nr:helix-turn-helix transcriptional regulator [Cryobacterium sp.]